MLNQLSLLPTSRAPKTRPGSRVKDFSRRTHVADFLLMGDGLQSLTLAKLVEMGALLGPQPRFLPTRRTLRRGWRI